ncbi:hypothetical protein KNP65_03615 [Latilactobacillus curvatus]|uniref:hypothetical protein n=1 Tax=Latilactobacillus curvatus TaxID=28038 RepID=UPI002410BAA2|nr:hypothetical protein [Latilactobacillus curvatus]MDG2979025.1 hypothetical protein [Latilactobacillus curvatus]
MLKTKEAPLITEVIAHMRIEHIREIPLLSYIEKKKIGPDQRVLLLAQLHRSEVVGIKYKYDGPDLQTIIFLKKQ